jgi:hypothetical protein
MWPSTVSLPLKEGGRDTTLRPTSARPPAHAASQHIGGVVVVVSSSLPPVCWQLEMLMTMRGMAGVQWPAWQWPRLQRGGRGSALPPRRMACVAGVCRCAVVEVGWLLPASTQAMVGGEAGLAAGGLTARHPTLGAWRRGGLEGLVPPPRLPAVVGVVARVR